MYVGAIIQGPAHKNLVALIGAHDRHVLRIELAGEPIPVPLVKSLTVPLLPKVVSTLPSTLWRVRVLPPVQLVPSITRYFASA